MTSAVKTCPRCGVSRTVTTRSHNLCASCRTARIHDDPNLALPPGQWVNHGLTQRWVPVDTSVTETGADLRERSICAARPSTCPKQGEPLEVWK